MLKILFPAATHIKLLNHARLNSNPIDNPTKLDVNHRNYNRSNHQRHPINQKHISTTEQSLATYDRYPIDPDPYWDEQADTRRFTERRKKTVRFDGQDSDDWSRWESERQGSQDSATKDSGIETSSTFTSSEDSNRGDGPKVSSIEQNNFFFIFCKNEKFILNIRKKFIYNAKIIRKRLQLTFFLGSYSSRIFHFNKVVKLPLRSNVSCP